MLLIPGHQILLDLLYLFLFINLVNIKNELSILWGNFFQ